MPRKEWRSVSDMISQAAAGLDSSIISTGKKYIPDIITFCEHEDYLDMKSNNMELYPAQRIMLKVFYRGSVGNEMIHLSEEEIELCKSLGLDTSDNGDVLGKYYSDEIFRELVLVWGRRSGKDFISSVVALYEAMKLLESQGGDPYAVYNIGAANPITILTVATAGKQADIAFQEVKDKLLRSKYFKDKIGPDGIESKAIYLLTPKDKTDNEDFKERKLPLKKGSIVVEVGHSNSDTLLGKSIFVLILDEVASYKHTSGSSGGDRIYTALTPSLNTFVRDEEVLSSDGKTTVKKVYDSKVVSISSPRGQDGVFYNIFRDTDNVPSRLSCRLPTWSVNPNQKEEYLRQTSSHMTEEMFQMEFGAEFSGTASENFFPRELVESIFTRSLELKGIGEPGRVYFAHLDPATTSHNYALVVIHKEYFIHPETRKSDYFLIVDHIKYWHPEVGKPINEEEVDEYVIALKRRFHLGLVTYDQWNSSKSIKKLIKNGIPSKKTAFTRRYKNIIYDELYRLVIGERIKIPEHQFLKGEMMNLQRKYTPNGYRVYPKKGAEYETDDLCVDPDTLVNTNNGIKKIKNVLIGELVLTNLGRYKKILDKSVHFTDKDIYYIKPYYSSFLIATENHPVQILDIDSNRLSFKAISNLTRDDYIIKPFSMEENSFKIDLLNYAGVNNGVNSNILGKDRKDFSRILKNKNGRKWLRDNNSNSFWYRRYIENTVDFGYFIGSYLAEGSCSDHGVAFGTHKKEISFRDKIKDSANKTFGIKKYFEYISEKNSCQLSFNSQIVKRFIKDIIGDEKSIEKNIPYFMMNSTLDFQLSILKGFFDGDGTKAKKTLKKKILFTTSSEKLAQQLQYLLLRQGVVSSYHINKRKGKEFFIFGRKSKNNSDLYNISVIDPASYNKLAELFGISYRKKLAKFVRPRYVWGKNFLACKNNIIRKIDSTGKMVANLSVEDDNTYVANGIGIHNCDCLAGACYNSISSEVNNLPHGKLVSTGSSPSGNSVAWRSMQGTLYGVGTGQQVSKDLERRASWPKYKR